MTKAAALKDDGPAKLPGSGTENTALITLAEALAAHGSDVHDYRRTGGTERYLAQCPAHDDGTPSLVVFDHRHAVTLHCRAGCKKQEVVEALGLKMGDLFSARYFYRDAEGNVTRTVERTYNAEGAKRFRQSGDTKGQPILYRLPEVTEAVTAGRAVYFVEGEKDADTLAALGVEATTAPMGATNVGKVDVTPLTGARVVVIPDEDAAGGKWLPTLLDRLGSVAASVEVQRVAVGKDVTDHIEAGRTLAELVPCDVPVPAGRRIRTLRVQKASELRPRATRWLYAEGTRVLWLPLGGLSLLGGREGVGKTTIAYGIAAQVTRGTLPGSFHGEPRGVVIAATEDAWEQTVIPRLLACEADLDRVFRVDAVTPEGLPVGLQLPDDVDGLTRLIEAESVALVLLDPLMSTVGAGLDTNKDADVRRALEPMSRLAAEAQVAILGLIHVNKSQGSDLLTRLMASRAFAAVARTVLFAAKDDAVPVAGVNQAYEMFLFGQIKNNLGAKVPYALRYRIEGRKVAHDNELDLPVWGSRIAWGEKVDGSIQEIVTKQETRAPAKESAQDRVEAWLSAYLSAHGESDYQQIVRAAESAGHNSRTLQRVGDRMGVVRVTIAGTKNRSRWSLPGSADTTVITDNAVSAATTPASGDCCDSADSSGRGDEAVIPAVTTSPGGAR